MIEMKSGKQPILRLWGGAGCGKSTTAAFVYAILKSEGYNVELVREYVKDLAWQYQTSEEMMENHTQSEFLEEQLSRQEICRGKVELIITDSPIGLQAIYGADPDLVRAAEVDYVGYDILVRRVKPYNPMGRFHTEEESIKIDELCKEHTSFVVDGDRKGAEWLALMMASVLEKNRAAQIQA